MEKYRNKRIVLDGIRFDSKKEAIRWAELRMLEKAGKISGLERQVRFELVPAQYVGGRLKERPCVYVADFRYLEGGKAVVEDTKGVKTPEYIIKRKLLLKVYGIAIKEV